MSYVIDWLEENKKKFKNRNDLIDACVKELKVSLKTVQNYIPRVWPSDFPHYKTRAQRLKKRRLSKKPFTGSCEPERKIKKNDIIAPDDFLTKIDVPQQIADFLDAEVGDGYIEDEKLRKHFGISTSRWREMGSLKMFSYRRLTYYKNDGAGSTKATVWSSVKGIEVAKDTISLTRYEA